MRNVSLFDEDRYEESNWRPKPLPSLDGVADIELDCETTGLRWWAGDRPIGMSIHYDGQVQYIPWGHAGGNLDEETVKRWAKRELRHKRITNINTKFDIHMLREWGVDLEEQGCIVADVAHQAALLDDHRRKFALEVLSGEFLADGKLQINVDPSRMAEYHASKIAPYAEKDVILVAGLKKIFWPMLTDQDLHEVRQLEEEVIYPTCEMERNAARIDVPKLMAWLQESEREYNQVLWRIAKEVSFQFNPDKSSDWVKLFRRYKIPIIHFTDAGRPSFSDAVLKHIDNPIIQAARYAGKLASLRSKFLIAYAQHINPKEGLLRFHLHQLRSDDAGTISGRYSSSDKNIQQVMAVKKQRENFELPKDGTGDKYIIRELFIAAPGYRVLAADAKQIEYRLFAHYANSKKILDAYAADPDLSFHELVHTMVQEFKPDITYKKAKDLNFAKVYGAGKDKVASMLELPRAESDEFVRIYDREFPEVPLLLRKASRLARERGYVQTLTKRRSRCKDRPHKALNGVIQGTAADINKKKIIELHRERKNTGFLMRMTVHDEVVGDSPNEECDRKVAEILNRQSYNLRVPILWDVQVGQNWKECDG